MSRHSTVRALFAAALLLPTLALADARVEARRHFKTGMALIADGKLDDGISELLEAYSIRPHPNVLFNIARAYEAAGRPADALVFYNRYLDANPPDADKVREVALRLEAQAPKKAVTPPDEVKKPAEKLVAVPQVDEATVKRLDALAERLERAVAKAEARAEAPLPAAETKPAAGAAAEEDFGVPYEETVVAASRRAQATLDAPNAITVITGDEIRASGLISLPDILRRVPGAEVMTMGLGSANVSFRGFNQRIANKVLVLVDGRPEYQDFLGVTLWPVLPVGHRGDRTGRGHPRPRQRALRRQRDAGRGQHHHPLARHRPRGRDQCLRRQRQPRRRQLRRLGRRQAALPRLGRLPAGRQVHPRLRGQPRRRRRRTWPIPTSRCARRARTSPPSTPSTRTSRWRCPAASTGSSPSSTPWACCATSTSTAWAATPRPTSPAAR